MHFIDVINRIFLKISKMIPKKKNRWIFGAWYGRKMSDNPMRVLEYVIENEPQIEAIWISRNPTSYKNAKIVKRNSLKSIYYILTAEVAFMNQGFIDFSPVNLLGGCYKVQLWHGVAWKKIVRDSMGEIVSEKDKKDRRVFDIINKYDLYISPSDLCCEVVKTAFNTDDNHILKIGQPRNEILFNDNARNINRTDFFESHRIEECKIVLYMPTFRDKTEEVFSFGQNTISDRIIELEKKYNFVVIEKSHFWSLKRKDNIIDSGLINGVYYENDKTAEYLLSIADILITDYSSCFFDFLITDRPIIHYLYDYDYYSNQDRGLYYPKEYVACGDTPSNLRELFFSIEDNLNNPYKNSEIRKKMRHKFIQYETDNNSEIIVNYVLSKRELYG
ncbi:MAG: CDP-glycerol glycerophosphotransferase family protein [Lachnospiraceae bacterium]|nr:CDP-glycerol glycerophosphotransferase family protein [Lachnospiraceae bacterium]